MVSTYEITRLNRVTKALFNLLQSFEYVNGVDVMMMAASQGSVPGAQPGMVPSHASNIGTQAFLAPVSQYHNVSPASLPQFATSASQYAATLAPSHYVSSSHHHTPGAASQGPPLPSPHTYATTQQSYQSSGQPGSQPTAPSPAFVPVSNAFADAMGPVVLQMAPGQQSLHLTMSQQPFIQVQLVKLAGAHNKCELGMERA